MNLEGDTIAAIATAAGVGGVGIVRVSGPLAFEIVEDIVGRTIDRQVRLAVARNKGRDRVDQVLVFGMRGPASFTGEDVAELHGHGGVHNLKQLLSCVLDRGARLAEPGEFTRRAVLHGKLDVVRAEALLEVIHAGSERALRIAQQNLGGRLGKVAAELESRALRVLAELEGRIDFPEDDLPNEQSAVVDAELEAVAGGCAALVDGFRHGHAIQSGISVALVGAVNVGKSSLFNALLGKERALVAAEPGTTRDYIEGHTVWDGVAVTVIDTAGIRSTNDDIEARGIALGEQRVAAADVVVVVNDGVGPWNDGSAYGARALVVRSKADLGAVQGDILRGGELRNVLATSSTTQIGLEELVQRILSMVGIASRDGSQDAVITTTRQLRFAEAARDNLVAALAARRRHQAAEVVALEVREAAKALSVLRGQEIGERVLDEVFARFCIGK